MDLKDLGSKWEEFTKNQPCYCHLGHYVHHRTYDPSKGLYYDGIHYSNTPPTCLKHYLCSGDCDIHLERRFEKLQSGKQTLEEFKREVPDRLHNKMRFILKKLGYL